eukprot:CAMPEP_0195531972 /NCGR_PEP_ID=MMETSP0794_2-20130614/36826_1 /TAXON_ID=515487 /ORGANISM="Stephanopyxis turris, Strain CCMP 815" /LENGTH=738 /DNA_ID=CAMNT_0040663977 /DNA_START=136 /DNA_END=2352 /DNA_ORIENTATION=-
MSNEEDVTNKVDAATEEEGEFTEFEEAAPAPAAPAPAASPESGLPRESSKQAAPTTAEDGKVKQEEEKEENTRDDSTSEELSSPVVETSEDTTQGTDSAVAENSNDVNLAPSHDEGEDSTPKQNVVVEAEDKVEEEGRERGEEEEHEQEGAAEEAQKEVTEQDEEQEEEEEEEEAGFQEEELVNIPPSKEAPTNISNHSRTHAHHKLRSYEANRRNAYGTKLTSSSLYWRSFRSLIHASLEETKRAENIIRAGAVADANYAQHMQAAFEDLLEEDGRPILDAKKKKKILKARSGHEEHKDKPSSPREGGGCPKKGFKLHEMGNRSMMDPSATERRGAMLASLVQSHSIVADRFGDQANSMQEEIIPEFTSLREQLEEEVVIMEALGDAILEELEAAEELVIEAWDSYYEVAVKSLSGGDASTTSGRRRSGASDAGVEIEIHEDCHDVWEIEMQYRMSVAFLSASWEKASDELSRLFTTMKETECSRRFRLRELLISSIQRKERLFLSLPSILTPVLKDLVNRPMDSASIEDDVQTSIRMRAQAIQREEMADRKKKKPGPGLSGVNAKEGNFELSSPLTSDLLSKAKVIEKKNSGMMAGWKTTLAVVTADSFLHLFDMPSNLKVQSGSAPEVAFHALVLPVEIPTEETIKVANGAASSTAVYSPKSWMDHLAPTASVVLSNSNIYFNDSGGNSAFEITETYFTQGASKVFGRTATRKFYLRTVTKEETKDWISILKSPK